MTAIANRLEALRRELASGTEQLAQLDQRRAELRDTLLRITGAIQVLEELLERQDDDSITQPDRAAS